MDNVKIDSGNLSRSCGKAKPPKPKEESPKAAANLTVRAEARS